LELPDPHIGIVLNVADKKHLFLDDDFIVETSVRVRPVMHSPVKKGTCPIPGQALGEGWLPPGLGYRGGRSLQDVVRRAG